MEKFNSVNDVYEQFKKYMEEYENDKKNVFGKNVFSDSMSRRIVNYETVVYLFHWLEQDKTGYRNMKQYLQSRGEQYWDNNTTFSRNVKELLATNRYFSTNIFEENDENERVSTQPEVYLRAAEYMTNGRLEIIKLPYRYVNPFNTDTFEEKLKNYFRFAKETSTKYIGQEGKGPLYDYVMDSFLLHFFENRYGFFLILRFASILCDEKDDKIMGTYFSSDCLMRAIMIWLFFNYRFGVYDDTELLEVVKNGELANVHLKCFFDWSFRNYWDALQKQYILSPEMVADPWRAMIEKYKKGILGMDWCNSGVYAYSWRRISQDANQSDQSSWYLSTKIKNTIPDIKEDFWKDVATFFQESYPLSTDMAKFWDDLGDRKKRVIEKAKDLYGVFYRNQMYRYYWDCSDWRYQYWHCSLTDYMKKYRPKSNNNKKI